MNKLNEDELIQLKNQISELEIILQKLDNKIESYIKNNNLLLNCENPKYQLNKYRYVAFHDKSVLENELNNIIKTNKDFE